MRSGRQRYSAGSCRCWARPGWARRLSADAPRSTSMPSCRRRSIRFRAVRTRTPVRRVERAQPIRLMSGVSPLPRCPRRPRGDLGPWVLETTGREAGRGPYLEMARKGHGKLGDATLRLVHQHWRDAGQPTRADQLAQPAWEAGCRDAAIAEGLAVALAAGGREADLQAGLAVCEEALTARNGNTDEAWASLAICKASIDARLERRRVRYATEMDENGRLKMIRPRLPAKPHRTRKPRFLRAANGRFDPAA